jgi:hypothetical protein
MHLIEKIRRSIVFLANPVSVWRTTMKPVLQISAVCLVVYALGCPSITLADGQYVPGKEASGDAMVFDTIIMRPLGIVASVIGAATFVVSLPFSLPTGSADEAAQKLLAEPLKYTFARPLGEFEDK